MGRVARYDEKSASIYILKSLGEPYPADKIKKTWEELSKSIDSIHPRIPSTYYNLLNEVHGRHQQEVDPRYSPYYNPLKDLSIKLLNLYSRSPEILTQVEKTLEHRPLLREFIIPVRVDDEFILFSPEEVEKMFQDNLIKVKINGKTIDSSQDFYRLAKEFALGKRTIEVVYMGEYDGIRGVIP
jgi:CRISPR-associated endonuclease/helicase Cas3